MEQSDEHGFTLIDLMVVVPISAVNLAFAVPTFLDYPAELMSRPGSIYLAAVGS